MSLRTNALMSRVVCVTKIIAFSPPWWLSHGLKAEFYRIRDEQDLRDMSNWYILLWKENRMFRFCVDKKDNYNPSAVDPSTSQRGFLIEDSSLSWKVRSFSVVWRIPESLTAFLSNFTEGGVDQWVNALESHRKRLANYCKASHVRLDWRREKDVFLLWANLPIQRAIASHLIAGRCVESCCRRSLFTSGK